MNPVAIFYGDTSIYYNSILIIFSLLCAFVLGLALYLPKHKYAFAYFIYFPLAVVSSTLLSRIIHWYCNMESYDDFKSAITKIDSGDYCISGIIIAVWFIAMLLFATRAVKKPTELLDPIAPGLAFVICIIRFSHFFSDSCRGEKFKNAFLISACIMLCIMLLTTAYHLIARTPGQTFRFFLLLFSAEEVFIDSIRNDASHLFFSGDRFAGLNKGASFMGLSQFFSAIMLIYLFVYFMIITSHKSAGCLQNNVASKGPTDNSHNDTGTRCGAVARRIFSIVLFVLGLIIAGGCEYLVQRFTGMWQIIYPGQIFGLCMIIASVLIPLFSHTFRNEL